ncbi:MAG: hypothetical protein ACJA0H_001925 [Francisellaceae bacterium]|jgi:hypothetical protein
MSIAEIVEITNKRKIKVTMFVFENIAWINDQIPQKRANAIGLNALATPKPVLIEDVALDVKIGNNDPER